MTPTSLSAAKAKFNCIAGRSLTLPTLLLVLLAGLWNLSGPPLWWDEGWTLSVARNWVERGHYGRLLAGEPAPPGLNAAFPVTAPIALSFKLFGVGIWQGRLFGVVCTVVALLLMFYLADRLYNRAVAAGTLVVLLLMSMHPQLHPLPMGRQVLAEMPMFVYLLAGYACLLAALRRSPWLLLPAIVFWGIARISKAQVAPFWTVSLAIPLFVTLLERRWRVAALLGIGLVSSVVASRAFAWGIALFLEGCILPVTPVEGLYGVMAFVLVPFNRIFALQMTLIVGLPTLLGLGYGAWKLIRERNALARANPEALVRLALLGLASSWFAWYLLLSVGVPRYLFPATFFGSLFVSALLYDLTTHFRPVVTLQRANQVLKLRVDRQGVGALLAVLLIAATVPLTLQTLYRSYATREDHSAQRVAHFFNTQTDEGILIETYESELHFLLNRRYHYPPDQTHVELNRRSLLQQDVVIDYDPLAADPDFLVVGRFSRENDLYAPVLETNAFRLLFGDGLYDVYERVR